MPTRHISAYLSYVVKPLSPLATLSPRGAEHDIFFLGCCALLNDVICCTPRCTARYSLQQIRNRSKQVECVFVMCLLAANRSQSKLIEHHSCPMHDDSTVLDDDDRPSGLEVSVEADDSGTATDTRRRFKLPSDRRHYNPSLTDAGGRTASSPRRTHRQPPSTADSPASAFLLLLVVACILLMMLVVGSVSYCAAVRSD